VRAARSEHICFRIVALWRYGFQPGETAPLDLDRDFPSLPLCQASAASEPVFARERAMRAEFAALVVEGPEGLMKTCRAPRQMSAAPEAD